MIDILTFVAIQFDNPAQAECLAQNIYFEARNQSYAGQLAVAHVTLNRVASPDFPDTICEVVKEGELNSQGNIKRHRCQFSWYCDGLSDTPKHREEWARSILNAQKAVDLWYASEGDITDGSLWYHAKNVEPLWARSFKKVMQIDDHIFYKRKQ